MNGGDLVGEVLRAQGVPVLFTLCGGHISPVLVGAKARGIRVVDTRHEATAVYAADAVARLTGRPGVAAVTAGPGLTNTITAVKNAQLAQSPVVLIGGAAPTVLQGRGALQDIDQMALLRPHVKWARGRTPGPGHRAGAGACRPGQPAGRARPGVRRTPDRSALRRICRPGVVRGGSDGPHASRVGPAYLAPGAPAVPPRRRPPGLSDRADLVAGTRRARLLEAAQRLTVDRPVIVVGSQALVESGHRRTGADGAGTDRGAGLPVGHGWWPARRRRPVAGQAPPS